ncbi:helix-turn-helix domain-containing protein [Priestia megaterium]
MFTTSYIKLLRQILGMTQREFSKALGISAVYQRHLENGIVAITEAYKKRLYKQFLHDEQLCSAVSTIQSLRGLHGV